MLSPSPRPPAAPCPRTVAPPPHAAPAPSCPPAAPLHRSTHHCRARRAHHCRVRRAHQRPRAQHPPAPCLRTVAPLHRSTRTRQRRRPPRPFCRCRYPLCCSPQRRYPPCRPIKPRIPSLRCGGPRAQLARIAPYASPFPRMRAISPLPGSIFASCMLFGVKMARSSPRVSISGCDRAVLDAWREELASAARPLRDSGLQFGRMGSASYRPYPACLTHECAPAILVALTAITPCRRLAIAAPAPPRARHPLHLAPPRGPRCSSGNSREMVR